MDTNTLGLLTSEKETNESLNSESIFECKEDIQPTKTSDGILEMEKSDNLKQLTSVIFNGKLFVLFECLDKECSPGDYCIADFNLSKNPLGKLEFFRGALLLSAVKKHFSKLQRSGESDSDMAELLLSDLRQMDEKKDKKKSDLSKRHRLAMIPVLIKSFSIVYQMLNDEKVEVIVKNAVVNAALQLSSSFEDVISTVKNKSMPTESLSDGRRDLNHSILIAMTAALFKVRSEKGKPTEIVFFSMINRHVSKHWLCLFKDDATVKSMQKTVEDMGSGKIPMALVPESMYRCSDSSSFLAYIVGMMKTISIKIAQDLNYLDINLGVHKTVSLLLCILVLFYSDYWAPPTACLGLDCLSAALSEIFSDDYFKSTISKLIGLQDHLQSI